MAKKATTTKKQRVATAPKKAAKPAVKATAKAKTSKAKTPVLDPLGIHYPAKRPAQAAETSETTQATEASAKEPNRKQLVINLISREFGASLEELMQATGWQAHSVRGLISTLTKKGGMNIQSSKLDAKRCYQLIA